MSQAYQRYVPPSLEGTISANKVSKRRAPGTLKKDGSQTVRFEMPFAVWCHTCKPHAIIGQGVRFNAVKRKVGNYYSTPIWSFRMKHAACDGSIEIQTDPKNTAYVVVEGGKARDYGEHNDPIKEGEGGLPILTAEERETRRENAFAHLEGRVDEKQQAREASKRIEELYEDRERDWTDPWMANKRIRASFRHERKILKREADATQALKDRIGTDMDILPATENDSARAKLVDFGGDISESPRDSAVSHPMFRAPAQKVFKPQSTRPAKADRKELLRQQLLTNTRSTLNPFGS